MKRSDPRALARANALARLNALADEVALALQNADMIANHVIADDRSLLRAKFIADDLASACDHMRDLADALADDLADDVAHARVLAYDLADRIPHVHAWARVVVDTLGNDVARDLADTLANDVARASDLAHGIADSLAQVRAKYLGLPTRDGPKGSAVRSVRAWRHAGRFSVRATEWATRVLPRVDRPHYRELYRSELSELAQGAHPRRAQAGYAIQVLLHALPLRRTLRAPVPAAQQRIR